MTYDPSIPHRWEKDGRYHVLERYKPTDEDRRLYAASFPPGNSGPFYRWSEESFDTAEQAYEYLQEAVR